MVREGSSESATRNVLVSFGEPYNPESARVAARLKLSKLSSTTGCLPVILKSFCIGWRGNGIKTY